jgi:leader peptidase (prepilin peptidase)/N-methyltransferase
MAYLSFLVFCFGACLGSFLNVCVYRIPRGESVVRPGSRCPKCGVPIAWFDNIPIISYLRLFGRCRACRQPISPRYAVVELITGLVYLQLWHSYGADPRVLAYGALAFGLILGTFIDLEHLILPDRVTLGGMVAGPLFSLALPALHDTASRGEALVASLAGLALGFGALWLVGRVGTWALKKDAMGFGDVKLLGAIGAFLGWRGVFFTVLFSSLIGSAVGLSLIAAGRKQWQSRIPYGPYLALAALVWIFWGRGWWTAYLEWMAGSFGGY